MPTLQEQENVYVTWHTVVEEDFIGSEKLVMIINVDNLIYVF
jgi:hypothetical protein